MKAIKTISFGSEGGVVLQVQELMSDSFGLFMWPSSHLLSRFVWEKKESFLGKIVIELGGGTGLPGLLAAHKAVGAAHVYITDRAESRHVLENCEETVHLNGISPSSCTVMGLSWGRFPPSVLALPPPDIILGADCFYHEEDFERLLATVTFLLSKKEASVFYTVVQDRGAGPIASLLTRWGLEAREIELGEEEEERSGEEGLHLIEMVLANRRGG